MQGLFFQSLPLFCFGHSGELIQVNRKAAFITRGCSWSGWFHTLLWENCLNIAYSRWCARCIHLRSSKRCYHHILRCQGHYVLWVMEQEAGLRSSLLGSGGRETNLCALEKKKTKNCRREPFNSLLLCADGASEDGEGNSRSLEQGSALHRCPEML